MPKGNRRIHSVKTDKQWLWEDMQMKKLGFESWSNADGRQFWRAPHGQLIRKKGAEKYLKSLEIIYDF